MAEGHTTAHAVGVAAAAYMSCSRIYNDYDGVQHDYTRKQGLVWQQVFLPDMGFAYLICKFVQICFQLVQAHAYRLRQSLFQNSPLLD